MPLAGRRPLKYAVVNKNTAATHTIAAGVPGRKLVVMSYLLVVAGAVVLTWQSNANPISGPLSPAASATIVFAGSEGAAAFETAVGEALNLTLGSAVQVSGHVGYVEDYV